MRKKASLKEQETLYLPPEIKDGALLSGVPVSDGNLIEEEQLPDTVNQPILATQVDADNSEKESQPQGNREESEEQSELNYRMRKLVKGR